MRFTVTVFYSKEWAIQCQGSPFYLAAREATPKTISVVFTLVQICDQTGSEFVKLTATKH
eukprot:3941366-Amphidinium_carterae.1